MSKTKAKKGKKNNRVDVSNDDMDAEVQAR